MGGNFKRLEKAEAELKEKIEAKREQCEKLRDSCAKLQQESGAVVDYVNDKLEEELREISRVSPEGMVRHGDWRIRRDWEEDKPEHVMSELHSKIRQVRTQVQKRYAETLTLLSAVEDKLVRAKFDSKIGLLSHARANLDKASRELTTLEAKYQHYFGDREPRD